VPLQLSVCYWSCNEKAAELLGASGDVVRAGRLLCGGVGGFRWELL
jgi:hypothetical protein